MDVVKQWYEKGKGSLNRMREKDIGTYASSIAFFLFLSMIPILMLVCAMLPYTLLGKETFIAGIMEIVPGEMEEIIIFLVEQIYSRTMGILSFAVLMTIWSAGKGMLALMRALNVSYGVEEERGYLHLRLLSSFYTVIILAGVLITLCLGVFGNRIFFLLKDQFPLLDRWIRIINLFRFFLVLGWLIGIFLLLYTFVPNRRVKLTNQLPGAILAGFSCNLCSGLFSLYLEYFDPLSAYGSLGTIIIFLLWLYCYCYIILGGANVNCILADG